MTRLFTPRNYQQRAVEHLLEHPRCALFAEPGLGKTVTALNVIDTLQAVEPSPALVVAPKRVALDTWPAEVRKWKHLAHLEVQPILGARGDRLRALNNSHAAIFTINYENLPWLLETVTADRWPYGIVVADESTKLKSFRVRRGGTRAAALGRVAHSRVRHWINLTGTPSPQGLVDLWGQTWFLDAGQRLGRTFSAFEDRWFRKGRNEYMQPLPYAQEQIQGLLGDICLTLRAADYLELPPLVRNTIYVDLPASARRLYRDMEREMYALIAGEPVEAFNAAARTIKCLQLGNGSAWLGEPDAPGRTWAPVHDAKLEALADLVEELSGNPLLVAYQFRPDFARLQKAFPQAADLATTEGMAAFKAGTAAIGLGHPASMGHGVDGLQEHCHTVAFFGHWWNLEERMQLIERVGPTRQYQAARNRPVFVHDIVARRTVDELVLARHETKRSVQDLLLDAMRRAA